MPRPGLFGTLEGLLSPAVQLLFFLSGASSLIYQVIWVRQFGQVFGNTIYSASLVVAVFMLGLGVGSWVLGMWADRHRTGAPTLLAIYALLEALIGALGVLVSLVLPRLGGLAASLSTYVVDAAGWQVLSFGSFAARVGIAAALVLPITFLMGGTLSVLIRYLTHAEHRRSGWDVAIVYGANTLGAAAGALLTDALLVPAVGLLRTQLVAVALNLVAAAGSAVLFFLARRAWVGHSADGVPTPPPVAPSSTAPAVTDGSLVPLTALVLGISGFAALGVEILWLRHLGIMLGGFRAVFSLLLAVMLLSLGVGAFLGGWLDRRFGDPGRLLMLVQAAFAATMLVGLGLADAASLALRADTLVGGLGALSPVTLRLVETLYNLRPMVLEVALPSLIAGCAYPLANAVVQETEATVGRRAGSLYAANTVGAVLGSVVVGYGLLPWLGMQRTALVLALVASAACVPLYWSRRARGVGPSLGPALLAAGIVAFASVAAWVFLPGDYVVQRALGERDTGERLLALDEGPNELVVVVEASGRGRGLLTNGHAMSSTATLDQRYMRALAHVPLLAMTRPERVLIIGFGVGNTTHAATLHPSVSRVDVVDLSRNVLGHAGFFADANKNVLRHPKVTVSVNDGRLHLQMVEPGTYDLIALEPPPIAYAGVASLYSREFYALAKSRLKPGGFISQWFPAYQVPVESSLAMARAFVDAFPQSVLLSGTQAELLLLGTTGSHLTFDPSARAFDQSVDAAVRDDLTALDLGSPRDVAAMFVGSSDTLVRATRESAPAIDDRPVQEYGVRSRLTTGLLGVPAALFELTAAPAWCPKCFAGGEIAPSVTGLDLRFALLQQAYTTPVGTTAAAIGSSFGERRILGSRYLGSVVPDTAEVHNILGVAALRDGHVDQAITEFEAALARDSSLASARANLGTIRLDQATTLLDAGKFAEALPLLRLAVELVPDDPEARNDLGVALASLGELPAAIHEFERAVQLAPDFAEAQRNLSAARATTP